MRQFDWKRMGHKIKNVYKFITLAYTDKSNSHEPTEPDGEKRLSCFINTTQSNGEAQGMYVL